MNFGLPLIQAVRFTPFCLLLSASFLSGQEPAAPENLRLVWSDEFSVDGAPDPSRWTYDLGAGGWGNNEFQTYTNSLDNARIENGSLIIEARQSGDGRTPSYTSARLKTQGIAAWQYGRIEARAKIPRTTGTWSAIWMLSEDAIFPGAYWPDNGEIDIMEAVGYEADPLFHQAIGRVPNNLHSTIHTKLRNGRDNTGIGDSIFLQDPYTNFNVYAVEWTEETLTFFVNDTVVMHLVKADMLPVRNPPEDISPWWPFDQRFFLILNIAVGGDWGGIFNNQFYPTSPYASSGINHDGEWPQRMEVDYVRVYAFEENVEPELWRGWPLTDGTFVNTQSWPGWMYVGAEPWLYSYALGQWILPESSNDDQFRTHNQWVYISNQ